MIEILSVSDFRAAKREARKFDFRIMSRGLAWASNEIDRISEGYAGLEEKNKAQAAKIVLLNARQTSADGYAIGLRDGQGSLNPLTSVVEEQAAEREKREKNRLAVEKFNLTMLAVCEDKIKQQASEIDELQGLSAQDRHIVISLKEEAKAQAAEIVALNKQVSDYKKCNECGFINAHDSTGLVPSKFEQQAAEIEGYKNRALYADQRITELTLEIEGDT